MTAAHPLRLSAPAQTIPPKAANGALATARARASTLAPSFAPRGRLLGAPAARTPAAPASWPQSSDDFDEEEPTWALGSNVEQSVPLRARTMTLPPPIPQGAPMARTRARSETTTQHIGDWQIEAVLGRGGTATVYAVRHREFGKRAALKLSHVPLVSGEPGVKVFAREARVVQLVEHPAMPDVFATGMHEGQPYLVMERLAGETLSRCFERGALDRAQSFDILIELCDVLTCAHEALVVHRDLKLDNVFILARPDADGNRVKLLDWGFARVLGEDDPLDGMIAGALNYVAPEQVRGQSVTPATDIYSLGVLAYRLLLGERPFTGCGAELLHRHVFTAPPDPTTLWPQMPRSLADVLVRMLAKQPSARPSLEEVRRVLCGARSTRRWRFSIAHAAIAVACIAAGSIAILAT